MDTSYDWRAEGIHERTNGHQSSLATTGGLRAHTYGQTDTNHHSTGTKGGGGRGATRARELDSTARRRHLIAPPVLWPCAVTPQFKMPRVHLTPVSRPCVVAAQFKMPRVVLAGERRWGPPLTRCVVLCCRSSVQDAARGARALPDWQAARGVRALARARAAARCGRRADEWGLAPCGFTLTRRVKG